MAATLFIIRIPNEDKNRDIETDELENNKEDIIIPLAQEEEEKRNSVTVSSSCSNNGPPPPTVSSFFVDSDLEVDAQKVEKTTPDSTFSAGISTSLLLNTENLNNNNECPPLPQKKKTSNENIEDIVFSFDDEDEEENKCNLTNNSPAESVSTTAVTAPTENKIDEEEENRRDCQKRHDEESSVEQHIESPSNDHGDDDDYNEATGPKSPGVTMLDFIPKEPIETRLKTSLKSMQITNVSWSNVEGYKQALFIDCGDPNRVEDILEKITSIGIGQKIVGTSVSLFPATVHVENVDANKDDESLLDFQKEKESEFRKSVKSRMIVAQVVETVRSNAVFTFDYCMFIILASMIAVIGLIENSSVILVASMLISPLMGPILAGTFGITIQNGPLRNLGIRSECIGLVMCIICGFICGLIIGAIQLQGLTGYIEEWPTMEMKSRGMIRSLWAGVFIALPSGAAVSLSVLGGNTGSLVGVAISASLLPPAVNAGMLWAFALLTAIIQLQNVPLHNSSTLVKGELGCLPFVDNNYEPVYSCDMAKEMGIMGSVSLVLTLINILCIFLVGVLMLKLKEVVPQTSSANTVEFWGSDIKVARDSYKTMKGPESAFLLQKFQNEWEKLTKTNQRGENPKKRQNIDFEMILQKISTSLPNNPYWTLPYKPDSKEEGGNQTAHTIHNMLPYQKWFHYETIMPSPGVRMIRPFSFPNYTETPTKTSKYKRHKRLRFNIGGKDKKKFTVTSVPESHLLESSEKML